MQVIFDKIEKLRAEPEHKRRRWTAGLTAGLTLIIGVFWVANLTNNLSGTNLAETPKQSPFGQVASVAAVNFDTFKNGLTGAVSGFISMFND